ncbi:uncharacterized protein LOC131222338 [Magnolia sinica]|uniref:uncharacterized protein LOC131222338 n=1 Tax=Magnolia sinica TaxID=86752 RepID=UPI0026593537|nr:uncharacterized protein LOC131222338 [Magnolia sinica]
MQGEEDELLPTMPVLPRLDRLDRLLQYLEERRNSSDAHYSCSFPINTGVDKQCKPLSSVLEEVHFKGTVMERVAMLENRVLQLSLEMEEGSTSSSSTIPTSEKIRNVLIKKDNGEVPDTLHQKQDHYTVQEKPFEETQMHKPPNCKKSSRHKRTQLLPSSRKCLGWFPMGC